MLPPPSAEGSPPPGASAIGQSVVVLSSGSTGLSEGLAENIFLDVITHMLQVLHIYKGRGGGGGQSKAGALRDMQPRRIG